MNLRRCKQVHALDYRITFSRPTGLSGKNQSDNPTVDGCIEGVGVGWCVVGDSNFFEFVVFQRLKETLVPRFEDVEC